MILKSADSKNAQLAELERLTQIADASTKVKINQELRALRAGIKGEKEAAYLIDFDLKDSKNTAVIHDLRLEVNGRTAQIDHLLIHRSMTFFVLESKHFHAGIKIGEDGQFLQWNGFKKTFEGMSSPLAQNERHITALKDLVSSLEWPTRLGMKLAPTYESYVLVSSQSRIDRPKKLDTSKVIKAEDFSQTLNDRFDKLGVVEVFGALAKLISRDTLQEIGKAIVSMHKPISPDYASKYGIIEPPPEAQEAPSAQQSFSCRSCNSSQLTIQYGKFGYYFKCSSCDGNTPIKIGCAQDGHKERLRKQGTQFFRECADCGTSSLFYQNK